MRKSISVPLVVLLVIALLLVVLHLALPTLVRNALNDQLAEMGEYRGHIEDVDLSLWRGAYRINNLSIKKARDEVQAPFLDVPTIELGVSWGSLWHDHAVVATVRMVEPKLNFVDSESESGKQTGEGIDWRETLEDMLLIRLDKVRIENGTLAFRNFSSEPPVNLYANNVNLTIHNLTNARNPEGARDASLDGKGSFLGHAPIEVEAQFDPLVRMENFDLRLRVTDVDLTRLNDFSSAYANFDFKAGSGDLVVEAEARDSQLDGYIKPLLHDVEIFDWEQDVENNDEGFLRGLWEAIVGGSESALENQRKDQFATRVQLSGSLKDAEISPFQAFVNILRNAFVEAFSARFEGSLDEE